MNEDLLAGFLDDLQDAYDGVSKKKRVKMREAEVYRGSIQVQISRYTKRQRIIRLVQELLDLIKKSRDTHTPAKFELSEGSFTELDKLCNGKKGLQSIN